jgi:anion-transporting  ArsA/GET3 family ATPase
VSALDTMFGGFRERAEQTYALLQRPETAFVVVATPEPDALREAAYFVERLDADRMPLAGLVLYDEHAVSPARAGRPRHGANPSSGAGRPPSSPLTAESALAGAERLAGRREHALARALLALHAERLRVAAREERLAERFSAAHPGVAVARVPAFPSDVHDPAALRAVGSWLAGGESA